MLKDVLEKYCPLHERPTLCKSHECIWWIELDNLSNCAVVMIALKLIFGGGIKL